MRTHAKFSLARSTRFIVMAGTAIAVMLLLNAAFSAYVLRENTIRERSQQLSNLSVVLSQQASQAIFSANTVLDSIIDVLDLAGVDTQVKLKEFTASEMTYELLKEKTRSNPIIDVATIIGSDGRVLNFSRSFPAPVIDLSDRDYFEFLKSTNSTTTFYSVPVQNKGNRDWVFYFAKRINDDRGDFLGVVLIGVSVKVFSMFYEEIAKNLGEGASLTLYRDDQTLLTRWPLVEDMIGVKNRGDVITKSLNLVGDRDGVLITRSPAFNLNSEVVTRMVSFRRVGNYPFIVGASLTKKLYLEGWFEDVWTVMYSAVISLAVLTLGMILLIKAQRRNAKIQFAVNHDSLTGLPNRVLFFERFQFALQVAKKRKSKIAVAFLDLDNFKMINDNYSHSAGDLLLIEIANRLRSCLRNGDTVGRIGGDEFVLLLPNIDGMDSAWAVCEKVREALEKPFLLASILINPTASVGLAVFPDNGETEAELLAAADQAMYQAKKSGRNIVKPSLKK